MQTGSIAGRAWTLRIFTRSVVKVGRSVVIAGQGVRAPAHVVACAWECPRALKEEAQSFSWVHVAFREHLHIDLSRHASIGGELTDQNALVFSRNNVQGTRTVGDENRPSNAVLDQQVHARFKIGLPAVVGFSNGGWRLIFGACRAVQPNGHPAVVFKRWRNWKEGWVDCRPKDTPEFTLEKRRGRRDDKGHLFFPIDGADHVVGVGRRDIHAVSRHARQQSSVWMRHNCLQVQTVPRCRFFRTRTVITRTILLGGLCHVIASRLICASHNLRIAIPIAIRVHQTIPLAIQPFLGINARTVIFIRRGVVIARCGIGASRHHLGHCDRLMKLPGVSATVPGRVDALDDHLAIAHVR